MPAAAAPAIDDFQNVALPGAEPSAPAPAVSVKEPAGEAFAIGSPPAAAVPEWLSAPVTGERSSPAMPARASEAPEPLTMPARKPAPLPGFSPGPRTAELELAIKRSRSRTPMFVVGALVLFAVVAGVWSFVKSRPPALDTAAVAADAAALDLLRRDDTSSLNEALARLEELEKTAPNHVPARANQVLPTLLLMRDLRDEISRLEARYAQLNKERDSIERKKETSDWTARSAAKIEEMSALKAQIDPLVEKAKAYDDRAAELLRSSKALADQLGEPAPTVTRAMALYYALKGLDSALRLADSYETFVDERQVLNDPERAFAHLARAAYYSQPPYTGEKRGKALKAAELVLAKDSKMVRALMLQAQVNLGNRQYAEARDAVEQILALNPKHAAAAALKQDIERAEKPARSAEASPE